MKQHYTKEVLETAVKNSSSIYQVLKNIHLNMNGGNHSQVKKWIKKYKLDTSHFTGQKTNAGINHVGGPKKLSPEEIFVYDRNNGLKESLVRLKNALTKIGRQMICRDCGLSDKWNGKNITLQVEHINGNPLDNREPNLCYLCPNCHSQTKTWGKKMRT